MEEASINVQCVHGGFILATYGDNSKVEVFTSQGKLMKALRTAIDEHSLVSKKNSDAAHATSPKGTSKDDEEDAEDD